VPYPQALLDDLRARAHLTGTGRLLDLGCGPGRVALPLSPYFGEVWAVDQEPEMIEVGREIAARQGATNIRWSVGRAEDVIAPAHSLELVTIGEAFHRFDRRAIANRGLGWLTSSGCLATLGCFGITAGSEPWEAALRQVVKKWSDRRSLDPNRAESPRGSASEEEVLTAAGFVDVVTYPFDRPHVWTLESILGNLYSTSGCSKRILGDEADRFEADIKAALRAHDNDSGYPETLRFAYTLARSPR
jgi:SAM-dependent methyltransferase